MSKIEVVLQHDLKDCGPCCLACLIKYYDGYVPISKIREDTYTTINGTSAYNLINAAKSYGFDATGVKTANILDERIYLPCIAHLELKNGLNHFVVIYKITKTHIYIMDPSVGKKKIPISEFLKQWTKILILMAPKTNILHCKKQLTINQLFFNLLIKNKKIFVTILIINFLLMFFAISSNFYLESAISNIDNIPLLKIIVVVFSFIFLAKIIFNYLKNYYLNYFNKNIDAELFSSFLKHIFYLPLSFIENRSVGEITTRVQELSEIKNLVSEVFTNLILNSVLIIGTVVALFLINAKLFFFLCLVISIYLLIGLIFSKILYYRLKENLELNTDFNTSLIENIEMNTSIKNLNLTASFLAKLENKLIILLKNNFSLQNLFNNWELLKELVWEFGLFLVLTYGIYLISLSKLEILSLITFNSLIIYLFDPIRQIIDALPKYNYLKASFNKIQEFINIEEEIYNKGIDGEINLVKFANVNYSYNKYQNIINSLSFEINRGDKVFLSGPTGSGKSTICKLICGYNKNYDGKITYNITSEQDVSLNSIRTHILYVSQEESLFTGTIKDNIICYRNIKNKDFLKVLKICRIEEIFTKRPNRLETTINASLNNLSGGEKQRIILARALLKNSNIIILDEALSEVDIQLEKQIIKDIIKYFPNKTLIYVSHKDVKNLFSKVIEVGK